MTGRVSTCIFKLRMPKRMRIVRVLLCNIRFNNSRFNSNILHGFFAANWEIIHCIRVTETNLINTDSYDTYIYDNCLCIYIYLYIYIPHNKASKNQEHIMCDNKFSDGVSGLKHSPRRITVLSESLACIKKRFLSIKSYRYP